MDSSLPPSYEEVMELNIPPTSYFQLFGKGPSDPDETTIEIVPPPSYGTFSREGPSIETTIEIPDRENQEIRIQRRRHSNQETNLSCWDWAFLIISMTIFIILGVLFSGYFGLITLSGPVAVSLMIFFIMLCLLANLLIDDDD